MTSSRRSTVPVPLSPAHRRTWRTLWRRCSCGLPAPCVDRLVPASQPPFPPRDAVPAHRSPRRPFRRPPIPPTPTDVHRPTTSQAGGIPSPGAAEDHRPLRRPPGTTTPAHDHLAPTLTTATTPVNDRLAPTLTTATTPVNDRRSARRPRDDGAAHDHRSPVPEGLILWTAPPPPAAGTAPRRPQMVGGDLRGHHVGGHVAHLDASSTGMSTAQAASVRGSGRSVPAQRFSDLPAPSSQIDDGLSGRPRRTAEVATDQRPDAWAGWSAHDDDCRGAAGRAGSARPAPMRSAAVGWARVGADPVDRTFGAVAGRAGNLTPAQRHRATGGRP
jgi:hypothetical protein